jgi:hypothetical protein
VPTLRWTWAGRRAAYALVAVAAMATTTLPASAQATDPVSPQDLAAHFQREVPRRLEVPASARPAYLARLQQALEAAGLKDLPPQHLLLVDRSPQVQMLAVLLWAPDDAGTPAWHWIGATPVSTGSTGRFDHFRTPLGVFVHTLGNPDFRAEGTFNENGIRGYGVKGMRVFDFGWAQAERGWGKGGLGIMRLQMHATDPDQLEQRLGRVDSKGCIRIPATLNQWLDRHGTLDADYLQAMASAHPGKAAWVVRADRAPLPWPGRWLVIVDSGTTRRPDWAVAPPLARHPAQAGLPVGAGVC